MAESVYREIKFSDENVVNIDNWIPKGEYNPHNVRPWLFHDHGFVVAVVFADSLQDAMDEAADADKFDRYLLSESDYEEYEVNTDNPTCSFLGNASEPFDIETLEYVELPNPTRSFCAQFNDGGYHE